MELNYKIVFSRWFSLWPDFQYVWKPSGDRQLADCPVFGLRVVFDH
jgi:carbohydrate-selective porin OprB